MSFNRLFDCKRSSWFRFSAVLDIAETGTIGKLADEADWLIELRHIKTST